MTDSEMKDIVESMLTAYDFCGDIREAAFERAAELGVRLSGNDWSKCLEAFNNELEEIRFRVLEAL